MANDPHPNIQLEQLKAAGVNRVYQEKISGTTQRPVLTEVLTNLHAGDRWPWPACPPAR